MSFIINHKLLKMKNFKQLLLVFLVLTNLISCKKDDDSSNDTQETISAKWVVDEAADYKSFEFNKSGDYIIVKGDGLKSATSQSIISGTYVIIDSETIKLSDFGTIHITSIDDSNISFSLTLEDDETTSISVNATKQEEISNSAKTELLCRTWEMVSINGETAIGTDYEITILFSQAGTYFVTVLNTDSENEGGLAQWKWKDNNENEFNYTWSGTFSDEYYVKIVKLTSSYLELYGSATIGTETREITYILKPATIEKSAVLKATTTLTNTHKSFLFKQ